MKDRLVSITSSILENNLEIYTPVVSILIAPLEMYFALFEKHKHKKAQ